MGKKTKKQKIHDISIETTELTKSVLNGSSTTLKRIFSKVIEARTDIHHAIDSKSGLQEYQENGLLRITGGGKEKEE